MGYMFYLGLYSEIFWNPLVANFRNLYVPSHKAYGYQILHVALSSEPSLRGVNYSPKVELIAKCHKFYIGLPVYSEICQNLFVRTHGYQF